ncbi:hypothetical protein C5C74_09460 [Rathayibacter sp. AY1E8]|uniref:hypothetical protein n=1 Tax=Rathayibacter sp. AY1E8 TaxID=2080555 RepID=UPI000CE7607D|nr:hypothetical protein [Rathayibacter sp. AY1E8]PPG17958.1 hypothetical protein C5C74_09460 [Rathayibacter sp. AY1E8]
MSSLQPPESLGEADFDSENLFKPFTVVPPREPDAEETLARLEREVEIHALFGFHAGDPTSHSERLHLILQAVLEWFARAADVRVTDLRSYGKSADYGVRAFYVAVSSGEGLRGGAEPFARWTGRRKLLESGADAAEKVRLDLPSVDGFFVEYPVSKHRVRVVHLSVDEGRNLAENKLIAVLGERLTTHPVPSAVLLGTADHSVFEAMTGWCREATAPAFWFVLPTDADLMEIPASARAFLPAGRVELIDDIYRWHVRRNRGGTVGEIVSRRRREARQAAERNPEAVLTPRNPSERSAEAIVTARERAELSPVIETLLAIDWLATRSPLGSTQWVVAVGGADIARRIIAHLSSFASAADLERLTEGTADLRVARLLISEALFADAVHGRGRAHALALRRLVGRWGGAEDLIAAAAGVVDVAMRKSTL